MFNWMGAPNKSSMLDRLGAMTHAAARIGRKQRENAFGHLVVLLRDVSPEEEDKARALLFDDEDGADADTDQEEDQLTSRNKTRAMLRLSFRSIRVWCLPRPHPDIHGKGLTNGTTSELGHNTCDSCVLMAIQSPNAGDSDNALCTRMLRRRRLMYILSVATLGALYPT